MANNRRKSAAIALAVIGIAGLSLASASTLDLTGGTLQAGTTDLTDCQPSGTPVVAEMSAGAFAASVLRADTTTGPAYLAGDVTLTGINVAGANNCSGKQIEAVLLDGANAQLATVTGTVGASSVTLTVGSSIAADRVEGIAVVISDN